jgi:perosamine synthetase
LSLIPHNRPTLGLEEEDAALRVIRSGWVAQGPEVELFEKEFATFMNIDKQNVVAVANGSAALFLALNSLYPKNKKISFPAYTCAAIRGVTTLCNGIENLIDVSKNTPNIDLNELKNNNSNIAIIPHMYGIPSVIPNNLSQKIIEDCAQSLGSKVNGTYVGTQGLIGTFSFHATKIITSGGQGGMIVSKDKNLIGKIRETREYGSQENKSRLNFQMTDIQAAIGREQLKKLPSFISRREQIFQQYKNAGLDLLDVPIGFDDKITPIRYRAIMKTKNPAKIIDLLSEHQIRATVLIGYSGLLGDPNLFPNTATLTQECVSLPIYPTLSDENVEKIIKIILN